MEASLQGRKYNFPNVISRRDFKSDFVWGSATSAYQIEGAAFEGGRHPSIWDAFCLKRPEAIVNGDNGNLGTAAYYKTKQDVQMMKKLGLTAYRFSFSWSRIFPGGKASMGVNQEGVDYYNNLINELLANGIQPYVTLFHWDTPNALEEDYLGFLSEKIIEDFVHYAEFCFWEFGDRVKHWITLNEPHNYSAAGYAYGFFAPGRGGYQTTLALASGNNVGFRQSALRARSFDNQRLGNAATEPYIVTHNLLLAHAAAAEVYNKGFKDSQKGVIGITLNHQWNMPLDPNSVEDQAAADRAMDFIFGWFMEPLYSGKYPQTVIQNVKERLPKFTEEQSKSLMKSYDFIGINYYTSRFATTAQPTDVISHTTDINVHQQPEDINGNLIGPQGGVDWFYSYAPGFYHCLMQVKTKYGDPLMFITENGYADRADNQKKIEVARIDHERVEYYSTHLESVRDAIRDGCKIDGYFAWSLMDNFEWDSGYSVRFGIFYVDYAHGNHTRYPKYSAIWFKKFLLGDNITT